MPTDIFISYATQDLEFVTQLCQELVTKGFIAQFDQDNDNNDLAHRAEIHNIIQDCQLFLLIQTSDSLESPKVREELSRAIHNYAKPVVALVWGPASQIPRSMQSLLFRVEQRLEFAGGISDKNFDKLIKVLQRFIPDRTQPAQAQTTQPAQGRRLSSLSEKNSTQKKAAINPIALGAQVISDIVIPLDLSLEDREFISGEVKWLFSAVDHLLKLQNGEIERSQPINEPNPSLAQTTSVVTNKLLESVSDAEVEYLTNIFKERVNPLTRLDTRLNRNLKPLLNMETAKGEAGKGDPYLQSQIKDNRQAVVEILQDIAQNTVNKAYGILITSPKQLIEILEGYVNPLALGALVISKVIIPLGLPAEDEEFVSGEIKWLFNAVNTYQRAYQSIQAELLETKKSLSQNGLTDKQVTSAMEKQLSAIRQKIIERSQPLDAAIPPDAERLAAVTNSLLTIPDNNELTFYLDVRDGITYGSLKGRVKSLLQQTTDELRGLETLLARETKMGEEGKRNVELQNRIRNLRVSLIQYLQEMAQWMAEAYGVLVTPGQLIELLERA